MSRCWPSRPSLGEVIPDRVKGKRGDVDLAWPPGTAPLTGMLASTKICSGGLGEAPGSPPLPSGTLGPEAWAPCMGWESVTLCSPLCPTPAANPGDPFLSSAPGGWGNPCG